jgi:protein-disulfide isomerase
MKTPVKATLIAVAVAVVLVLAAVVYALVNRSPVPPPEGGASPGAASVVRENSHVLDDGGPEAVTVVEFLDFECEALGLDMAAYDAAVADPATAERVELDFNEGRALGVGSTPTFFVDGELQELQEWDDLETAIQAAVNGES